MPGFIDGTLEEVDVADVPSPAGRECSSRWPLRGLRWLKRTRREVQRSQPQSSPKGGSELGQERHRGCVALESGHCLKDPVCVDSCWHSLVGVRSWGQGRLLPFPDSLIVMRMTCIFQGPPINVRPRTTLMKTLPWYPASATSCGP